MQIACLIIGKMPKWC